MKRFLIKLVALALVGAALVVGCKSIQWDTQGTIKVEEKCVDADALEDAVENISAADTSNVFQEVDIVVNGLSSPVLFG